MFQVDTAYELYKECQNNGIPLSTNVYNGMLSAVGFLKENSEMQWQMICEILQDMKSQVCIDGLYSFFIYLLFEWFFRI